MNKYLKYSIISLVSILLIACSKDDSSFNVPQHTGIFSEEYPFTFLNIEANCSPFGVLVESDTVSLVKIKLNKIAEKDTRLALSIGGSENEMNALKKYLGNEKFLSDKKIIVAPEEIFSLSDDIIVKAGESEATFALKWNKLKLLEDIDGDFLYFNIKLNDVSFGEVSKNYHKINAFCHKKIVNFKPWDAADFTSFRKLDPSGYTLSPDNTMKDWGYDYPSKNIFDGDLSTSWGTLWEYNKENNQFIVEFNEVESIAGVRVGFSTDGIFSYTNLAHSIIWYRDKDGEWHKIQEYTSRYSDIIDGYLNMEFYRSYEATAFKFTAFPLITNNRTYKYCGVGEFEFYTK